MTELFSKVLSKPYPCKIFIDFSGQLVASNSQGVASFFNSKSVDPQWFEVYSGKAALSFGESSTETPAGTIYNQKVKLRFPSNDTLRAVRIDYFRKAKFIAIQLTDKRYLVIGRNDFFQNRKPVLVTESNEQLTEVNFDCRAIAPAAFLVNDENGIIIDENVYSINLETNVTLTGALNGSNDTFTTSSPFVSVTTRLFRNGIRQKINIDYTEVAPNTIVFAAAPLPSDILIIDYQTF